MKHLKTLTGLMVLIGCMSLAARAEAGVKSPLLANSMTPEWCDVRTYSQDQNADGNAIAATLRHRISQYNASSKCLFYIFFTYENAVSTGTSKINKTLQLDAPLVLENVLTNRVDQTACVTNGVISPKCSGVFISGYGTEFDAQSTPPKKDLMGITLDATSFTNDASKCAIVVKNGFQAKQQIKGITIKAHSSNQRICDHNGVNLMNADDPWCPGKKGKDCSFADVSYSPPDTVEDPAPVVIDRDGDGVPDTADSCLDDDGPVTNGGCPTSTHCVNAAGEVKAKDGVDADGDGIDKACDSNDTPNATVTDDDGDGVDNAHDKCPNTPAGTNVTGYGCTDADQDGVMESCSTYTGGLCITDNCPGAAGPSANFGCPVPVVTPANDADGDTVPDAKDKCPNLQASVTCAAVIAGQYSGQGVTQPNCNQDLDFDNDGKGNYCDNDGDIDGDGLADATDPNPNTADADGDHVCDGPVAKDISIQGYSVNCSAGPDACPLDSNPNHNAGNLCGSSPVVPPVNQNNTDGDGILNNFEDKNSNGVVDIGETCSFKDQPLAAGVTMPASCATPEDSDSDGFMDGVDCFPLDTTKQACGSLTIVKDPDFDNDGICDEAKTVAAADDPDGVGCTPNAAGKADNCPGASNANQADSNNNDIGDICDPTGSGSVGGNETDTDNDGLPDDMEDGKIFCSSSTNADTDGDGLKDGEEANGATYQGGFGLCDPDVDGDQVCDGPNAVNAEDGTSICTASTLGDNCPLVWNTDQVDSDANGKGDVCEGDTDGDKAADDKDNCAFIANEDQADTDGDGIGDACDPDFSESLNAAEGCGCRIEGKSAGTPTSMMPFLGMFLPLVMFRIFRKRSV